MKTNLKKGILSTPYLDRTKDGSNPPAQFGILLQEGAEDSITRNILTSIAMAGLSKFGLYSVGVDLMLSGGLRLSELLSANTFFVNSLGQVVIHGSKGSADKLVTPLYHKAFWLKSVGWRANPFVFVSRFSWYRFLKAQGVCMHEKGRGNNIVTHAARKLQAHNLFNGGVAIEGVRDIIGHRSISSTRYYSPSGGVEGRKAQKSCHYGKE